MHLPDCKQVYMFYAKTLMAASPILNFHGSSHSSILVLVLLKSLIEKKKKATFILDGKGQNIFLTLHIPWVAKFSFSMGENIYFRTANGGLE